MQVNEAKGRLGKKCSHLSMFQTALKTQHLLNVFIYKVNPAGEHHYAPQPHELHPAEKQAIYLFLAEARKIEFAQDFKNL